MELEAENQAKLKPGQESLKPKGPKAQGTGKMRAFG